jgi:hypothetical protein
LITLGTAYDKRVGNKIFVKDLEFIMMLNNKDTRPNVTYRVSVVACPATGSTDDYSELFVSGAFSGNFITNNAVLLYDQIFPTNQGSTMSTPTKERTHAHRFTISVNKPVVYNTIDGACQTRIIAFVNSYDAYGTLVTDNIASIAQGSHKVTYVDA